MEVENYTAASYNGTKKYTQLDVVTTNATGFGAASDDYMERGIDLNEQLIRNKPATFFMKITSNSLVNAGILKGDIAIVDKSIKPQNGKIVIAVVDNEMLIRFYQKKINKVSLIADAPKIASIEINEDNSCIIWGVVTGIIREL